MATTNSIPQNGTATQLTRTEQNALEQRARETIGGTCLLGIDAEGAIHYYSMPRRSVAVFDTVADTDPATFDLRELSIAATPRAWARHVARQRGLWSDLRLSANAQRQLEADA